jgi:hypothetical protein
MQRSKTSSPPWLKSPDSNPKKEQRADDNSQPGDIFIPRLDSEGPVAIDVTIRHTQTPSNPLSRAAQLPIWQEKQEADKHRKYDATCSRRGWRLTPFVLDCFGGMGQQGRSLMSTLLKALLGQREGWLQRQTEAEVWQGLSLTLAKEISKQLVWSFYTNLSNDTDLSAGCHLPYSQ